MTTAAAVRRKLHAWELLHLREWAAQLEAENEQLRERCERAESDAAAADARADMFQEALLQAEGVSLGLTRDGAIVVTPAQEKPL